MDWLQESLATWCTFEEAAEKTNCQKMNVNFLEPIYLDESSNLVSRGQNLLKLLYSIMILDTIFLACTAGRINSSSLRA
jgi:hypothetical protein